MLTGQKGVKYGLEVRKTPGAKAAAPPPKKRSVFGDDDSDEEQAGNVEQQIARQAARKQSDKKVRQRSSSHRRSMHRARPPAGPECNECGQPQRHAEPPWCALHPGPLQPPLCPCDRWQSCTPLL